MKMNKYKIVFWNGHYENGPEEVYINAMARDQAVILAKADRIKQGKDYTLYSCDLLEEEIA